LRYKGIDPDDPLQTNVLALERGRPVAGIGLGIAVIGSGIADIGGGMAFGIAGIGLGIAVIGSGIAVIGEAIAAILDHDLTLGIAGIGVGIAAVGGGIWIVRALAVGGGTTVAVVGGTEAITGPPAGEVAAADPTPPVAPAGRVGRHARPDPD